MSPSTIPVDRIRLSGLSARGYHGVLQSEREEGQLFIADVVLGLGVRGTAIAAVTDSIDDAIDYASVAAAVVGVIEGEPVNLIETLASRVADVVLGFGRVHDVEVTIHKPQAPVPVAFDDVSVTIVRTMEDIVGTLAGVTDRSSRSRSRSRSQAAAQEAPAAAPAAPAEPPVVAEETAVPAAAQSAPEPPRSRREASARGSREPMLWARSRTAPSADPAASSAHSADSGASAAGAAERSLWPAPVVASAPAVDSAPAVASAPAAAAEDAGAARSAEAGAAEASGLAPGFSAAGLAGAAGLAAHALGAESAEHVDEPYAALSTEASAPSRWAEDPAPVTQSPARSEGQPRRPSHRAEPVEELSFQAEQYEQPRYEAGSPAQAVEPPVEAPAFQAEQYEQPANLSAPEAVAIDQSVQQPSPLPGEPPSGPGIVRPTVPTMGLVPPRLEMGQPVAHAGVPSAPSAGQPFGQPGVPSAPSAGQPFGQPAQPFAQPMGQAVDQSAAPMVNEPPTAVGPLPGMPVAPAVHVNPLDQQPAYAAQVVLALGANVGKVVPALRAAVHSLTSTEGLTVTAVAPLARTAAVTHPGAEPQPDYLNTVVLATTTMSPRQLLSVCQGIESAAGRVRSESWGPRTLDIDIISFEGVNSGDPILTLPHPRAAERAFVLVPWSTADPFAELGGRSVAALAEVAQDRGGIRWLALDWLESDRLPALPTGQYVAPPEEGSASSAPVVSSPSHAPVASSPAPMVPSPAPAPVAPSPVSAPMVPSPSPAPGASSPQPDGQWGSPMGWNDVIGGDRS